MTCNGSTRLWLVYSPSESEDGGGYWSNQDGWGSLDGATRFSSDERAEYTLPMSAGGDAAWISDEVANESVAG